jgi:hypothetical protein
MPLPFQHFAPHILNAADAGVMMLGVGGGVTRKLMLAPVATKHDAVLAVSLPMNAEKRLCLTI